MTSLDPAFTPSLSLFSRIIILLLLEKLHGHHETVLPDVPDGPLILLLLTKAVISRKHTRFFSGKGSES